MFKQRKGITPVIAIVLLLLVTVGAVGVVYTQFQNIANQGNTEFSTQARNTHVQIDSLSSANNGNNTTLVFTNRQDSVAIDDKNRTLQLSLKPNDDSGYQSWESINQSSSQTVGNIQISPDSTNAKSCFEGEPMTVGQTNSCALGIQWPDATETFGVRVSVRGASNSDSLDCTISTGNTVSCS